MTEQETQETQETNEQNEAETTQETKAKSPKLNTPTKATELILKHLTHAQKQKLITELTDETKEKVAQVIVALYTDYEINDVVPTLDGFTAKAPDYGITDQALIDAALAMKKDPFIKSSKAPVAIAVILIAALAAASVYVYTSNQTTETEVETEIEEVIEEAVAGVLDFDITAENWTEDSSPFIAHVTGKTDEGNEVDFYHAVWADGSTDTVELDAGEYTVTWTSAINADGSIYVTDDVVTEVTVESDGTVTGAETFDQIAAEDVTSEQLEEILAEIAEAVANGDETLTSDAGTTVVEVASTNAANNPNADEEAVEEAAESASESVSETATSTSSSSSSGSSSSSSSSSSSTSNGSSSGSSGSSSSGSSSSSSGGSNSSSSSSSSGGSSSSSSSSSSSHTHTWQANTTQQWVVDQEGYYETTKVDYCECYCGETFDVATDWSAHSSEMWIAYQYNGTISLDEFSKHVGYYNKYKTVQTWVDEVGHYETVTTGYTCTSCGATKSA